MLQYSFKLTKKKNQPITAMSVQIVFDDGSEVTQVSKRNNRHI